MHRIDTSTADANANGTGKAGFVGKTLTAAPPVPATRLDDDWCNAIQEQPALLIEHAGVTLAKGTETQLIAGVQELAARAGFVQGLQVWATAASSAFASTPADICVDGDGEFRVAAAGGLIRVSTNDGDTWSTETTPNSRDYYAIDASGTFRVAVGNGTAGDEVHSKTGAGAWTAELIASSGETFNDVCTDGTAIVFVGDDGGGSPYAADIESASLTAHTFEAGVASTDLVAVATDGTDFVCIGTKTGPEAWEILKLNGTVWEEEATGGSANHLSDIHYCALANNGAGVWIAVGDEIHTSADGATWTERTSSMASIGDGKVTSLDDLILHYIPSTGQAEVSRDGVTWKRIGAIGASVALALGTRGVSCTSGGDARASLFKAL